MNDRNSNLSTVSLLGVALVFVLGLGFLAFALRLLLAPEYKETVFLLPGGFYGLIKVRESSGAIETNALRVNKEGLAEVPNLTDMLVWQRVRECVSDDGSFYAKPGAPVRSVSEGESRFLFYLGSRSEDPSKRSPVVAYWLVGSNSENEVADRLFRKSRMNLQGQRTELSRYGRDGLGRGDCEVWLPRVWQMDARAETIDLLWLYDDVRWQCGHNLDDNKSRARAISMLSSLVESKKLIPASRTEEGGISPWGGEPPEQMKSIKDSWENLDHPLKHDEIVLLLPGK